MGLFGGFEVFVTISVLYECVMQCMSLASLRYESNYWEIILVQVKQFGFLLQMQRKCQKLRIANFGYFDIGCGIVLVLIVFFLSSCSAK